MPNHDFLPMSDRLAVTAASENETAVIARELRAVAATLPDAAAMTLPRKRVWDRLSAEMKSGESRARGAA
ncbi:MAG: hypothetical protein DK306_000321 [Chloroflexi bacterium]|nr:MAG: hypothetical protein DK306_000321 [Chloroflexota bacterium]